jgi:hypothetical protein
MQPEKSPPPNRSSVRQMKKLFIFPSPFGRYRSRQPAGYMCECVLLFVRCLCSNILWLQRKEERYARAVPKYIRNVCARQLSVTP